MANNEGTNNQLYTVEMEDSEAMVAHGKPNIQEIIYC